MVHTYNFLTKTSFQLYFFYIFILHTYTLYPLYIEQCLWSFLLINFKISQTV